MQHIRSSDPYHPKILLQQFITRSESILRCGSWTSKIDLHRSLMGDDRYLSYGVSLSQSLRLRVGVRCDHPLKNRLGCWHSLPILTRESSLTHADGISKPKQTYVGGWVVPLGYFGLVHHKFHGPPSCFFRIPTNHNAAKRTALHVILWHPNSTSSSAKTPNSRRLPMNPR